MDIEDIKVGMWFEYIWDGDSVVAVITATRPGSWPTADVYYRDTGWRLAINVGLTLLDNPWKPRVGDTVWASPEQGKTGYGFAVYGKGTVIEPGVSGDDIETVLIGQDGGQAACHRSDNGRYIDLRCLEPYVGQDKAESGSEQDKAEQLKEYADTKSITDDDIERMSCPYTHDRNPADYDPVPAEDECLRPIEIGSRIEWLFFPDKPSLDGRNAGVVIGSDPLTRSLIVKLDSGVAITLPAQNCRSIDIWHKTKAERYKEAISVFGIGK